MAIRHAVASALILLGGVAVHPGREAFAAKAQKLNPTSAKLAVVSASASLVGDRVSMTIRLAVNAGSKSRHASASVDLPTGSVVTSAETTVRGVAIPLTLSSANAVDDAYEALRLGADAGPRGGAIRISESGYSGVDIDALLPDGGKLEVTLHVDGAACFWHDARYVAVPAILAKKMPRKMIVSAKAADQSGLAAACDKPASYYDQAHPAPAMLRFADSRLAKREEGTARFGTSGARITIADEQVGGVEFAIASAFSEVPKDLHTVLVVDGSRSMWAGQEDQVRVVEAYLRAAAGTDAQIVQFDRTATALTSAFTSSATLLPRVGKLLGTTLRNGSDPGQGIALAGQLLKSVNGVRRVVLITDELTAKSVAASASQWQAKLPANTVLHLVVVNGYTTTGEKYDVKRRGSDLPGDRSLSLRDGYQLMRDDSAHFASVASSTGGMSVTLVEDLDLDQKKKPRIDATFLARPTAIDELRLVGSDWATLSDEAACVSASSQFALVEGRSCRWVGYGRGSSTSVTVTGMIWGTPYTRIIELASAKPELLARDLPILWTAPPSPTFARETRTIAKAVNGAFSLGGHWGGTGGYDGILTVAGVHSSCGCGGSGSSSSYDSGIGVGGPTFEQQMRKAMALCHVDDAKVELTLETTLNEIVFVAAKVTRAGSKTSTTADVSCVENAVWDSTPNVPRSPAYKEWSMTWAP